MSDESRPDPDALLASLAKEREQARRGKLKIFFGMCPGVGKTYAMMQDARARHAAGVEVLIGIVETHGRRETEALLEGLPIVPRAKLDYRGTTLEELDLDAILLWHPKVAIVDELAHTNAPGSRHPKRYQDILELLAAGIDVHTCVNVQHIESRRDAVQAITGIAMRETVPDSILDAADEIILIDLTPEQLRARLSEGKVYLGARAAAASENYFREGNLLALREMSLRLVAEHVESDLRAQPGAKHGGHRLMVAVSASPSSEQLIRYTRRIADMTEGAWMALHIETGRTLPEAEQARLAQHLTLARQLGADVISISGVEIGEAILRAARQHRVSHLVIGKPQGRSWFRTSPVEWLIRHSGEIDLHLIRAEDAPRQIFWLPLFTSPWWSYVVALAVAAVVTGIGALLLSVIGYWSVALLYLLAVVLSAMLLQRGPILFLAAVSALAWDFLFIPPRFTFAIKQLNDGFMFGIFFVVALVAGQLTTRLRHRELAERRAEERAMALYELTRAMAASSTLAEAVRVIVQQVGVPAAVLLPSEGGLIAHPESTLVLSAKEESVANWSYQRRQPAGRFTDTLPDAEAFHLPLLTGERCEGVLALQPKFVPPLDRRELLETMAAQLASFLQKDRALQRVREAQLAAQSQKLQKALFDSVSHELKTPLATVSGLLEQPSPDHAEIRHAVRRLTRTVELLLDATRLESGLLKPNLEWCEPAELAQEALALAGLDAVRVRLTSAADLPPVRVDAGLIAQAIAMLLANAVTHGPADTPVELHLAHDGGALIFSVMDRGPGLRAGEEEKVFGKFYRGAAAPPGGLGLGLAIARQLVELHGGNIAAQNRPGGGALFSLRLPASERMQLPAEKLA